jgi:hypothetical protein
MRQKTIIILFLAMSSIAAPAQGHKKPAATTTATAASPKEDPKAKDAVLALEKLEATIESGVELQDYSKALADANFPVKMYLSGDSAALYPALTSAIEETVKWYRAARSVWTQGVVSDFPIGYCAPWTTPIPPGGHVLFGDGPHMAEELCVSYPELVTTEPDSRHYDATDNTVTENRKIIRFNDAQQKAWKLGSVALRRVELAMK